MSSAYSTSRPSIQEILAPDLLPAAGDSGTTQGDIAEALGPLTGMPKELFHFSIKTSELQGHPLEPGHRKVLEWHYPYQYAQMVRALGRVLTAGGRDIVATFDTPSGAVIEAMTANEYAMGKTMLFEIIDEGPNEAIIRGTCGKMGQVFTWEQGKRSLQDMLNRAGQYALLMSAR